MPELCRFRGIVITIYADDHLGPHFHARYGEHDAQIAIGSAEVIAGYLPRNARRQVLRWAIVRRGELIEAWNKAQRGEHPGKIAPLS